MVDEREAIGSLLELDRRISLAEEHGDTRYVESVKVAAAGSGPTVVGHETVDNVWLVGPGRGVVLGTAFEGGQCLDRVRLFQRAEPSGREWRLVTSAILPRDRAAGVAEDEPAATRVKLPAYLDRPPANRHDWERPTAWLLGTQVLSSMRKVILSALHSGFDLRDWMSAGPPISLRAQAPAQEYWIDYLADTGDAPRLVYGIASLIQKTSIAIADSNGKRVSLPRGSVLVVGGDTAYPVADKIALRERVQAPFVWAHERVREEPAQDSRNGTLLLGVAANHDYYDMLDGFARQFRKTASGENLPDRKHGRNPPLALPGYRRAQQASYFALNLPFDWSFWGLDLGLDAEKHGLDTRQLQYFKDLGGPPRKLIVATSVPVIVHGAAVAADHALTTAYEKLELGVPFEDGKLKAGFARIDLSGDTHTYERYYGESVEGVDARARKGAVSRPNYAAVVSGLGGAFHHPGQVQLGTIEAQEAWPPASESAVAVGSVLMRPRKVFQAGSVGVLGAFLAVLFYHLGAGTSAAPSALDAPILAANGRGSDALSLILDLGRVGLYVLMVLAWVILVVAAAKWSRKSRARIIADREEWTHIHRALHRIVYARPARWIERFFGANPRVLLAVLLETPAWAAVGGSLVALVYLDQLSFFSLGARPHLAAHALVVTTVLALLALPIFLGKSDRASRRVLIIALGLLHGVLQVEIPFLWARFGVAYAGLPLIALLGYWVCRPILERLLHGSRRTRRWSLLGAWMVLAAAMVAGPLFGVSDSNLHARWYGYLMAGVGGGFFACLWIGWYFLVALQWDAHGNEAGAVARIDDYAEFLRIRLTEDSAEVWTVAVSHPEADGHLAVEGKLIDHFTVRVSRGA